MRFLRDINEAAKFVVSATATAYNQLLKNNDDKETNKKSGQILLNTESVKDVRMNPGYDVEETNKKSGQILQNTEPVKDVRVNPGYDDEETDEVN